MASKIWRLKAGMGGSRCGRGRSEKTAVMKAQSKKLRRRYAKRAVAESAMAQ